MSSFQTSGVTFVISEDSGYRESIISAYIPPTRKINHFGDVILNVNKNQAFFYFCRFCLRLLIHVLTFLNRLARDSIPVFLYSRFTPAIGTPPPPPPPCPDLYNDNPVGTPPYCRPLSLSLRLKCFV